MVKLADGYLHADSSLVLTASYSIILFEHPFMRENEYGIREIIYENEYESDFNYVILCIFFSFSYWVPRSHQSKYAILSGTKYHHNLFILEICCDRRVFWDGVRCQKTS